MRITLKESTDYQLIAWMDAQLFPSDFPITRWDSTKWWVGYYKGAPVCYCGIIEVADIDFGYFNRAGVLPEAQGYGIQRKMIKKRIEYARKCGWTHVITDTCNDNVASINNLIKCGFKTYLPQELWGNDSTVYWIKGTERRR